MSNYQTILNCSPRTTAILLTTIAILFIITGCTQIYKTLGLTDEQAQAQQNKDAAAIAAALDQGRTTIYDIITVTIAALGTFTTGLLAKWLNTERKITTALITGVESSTNKTVKKSIQESATALGIEPKLHKRVLTLT